VVLLTVAILAAIAGLWWSYHLAGRLTHAEAPMLEEGATTCCYAKSEKSWVMDPQGVAWETFHTTGDSTVYGRSVRAKIETMAKACCGSAAPATSAAE